MKARMFIAALAACLVFLASSGSADAQYRWNGHGHHYYGPHAGHHGYVYRPYYYGGRPGYGYSGYYSRPYRYSYYVGPSFYLGYYPRPITYYPYTYGYYPYRYYPYSYGYYYP